MLERFPANLVAHPPFALPEPPSASTAGRCTHPGCQESVSRTGHTLCLAHWKAAQQPARAPAPEPVGPLLSASAIGERLGISNRLVNAALVELDDEILRTVDDHLPRLLLAYGVVIA